MARTESCPNDGTLRNKQGKPIPECSYRKKEGAAFKRNLAAEKACHLCPFCESVLVPDSK